MYKMFGYEEIKKEFVRTDITDLPKLIKLANWVEKHITYNEISEKIVKIAVLGTCSIQYICKLMKLFLLIKYNIYADIYEGEYDGIYGAVLDETSEMYLFSPEIIILIPDINDIKEFPSLLADEEDVERVLRKNEKYYQTLWEKLFKTKAHIFQANFVLPPISQLGNLEANYSFSKTSFLRELNSKLIRQKPNNVTFLDFESLSANFGKNKWFDYSSYFLYKQGFHLDFLGFVCDLICCQVASLSGITKKCLVLDLDNTIWGGIVGDDGFEGIQLDPTNAVGEAYRFFQKYVLELKNRGVILAVCSKNDIDIAKEPFLKNNNMVLKLGDISCFIANWEDKAVNLFRIAKELNIGTDSLVYFDDNPAEQEIIKLNLPEVTVINTPDDPADYALALDKVHAFDWLQITQEDLTRSSTYIENETRKDLENSFVNYNEYLKSLNMIADIGFLDPKRIQRFVQLINKTNQFNLRTKRYFESDIAELIVNDNYRLIYAELSDKFSIYGLISCVILQKKGDDCFIDTWLMSCRVIKRGLEYLVFNFIVKTAKELNCSRIVGEFIPTSKNAMAEDFYLQLGFQQMNNYNTYVFDEFELIGRKTYIALKGDS